MISREEDAFRRVLALEMGGLHEGLVTTARRLADLLLEEDPQAPTRGEPHRFDREALVDLEERLPPLERARLSLPIRVFVDADAPGNCYVADVTAIGALQALGAVQTTPREGKLWLAVPIARDLARRWPSTFEFALI